MLCDQCCDLRLISGIADRKRRAWRHHPIEAGCEIVERHNALSSIEERVNHLAAEIAGAAGDEDCHAVGYPIADERNGGRPVLD